MYNAIRENALDRCDWKGGRGERLALQYIEACRYDGDVKAEDTNFMTGSVSSEEELQRWVEGTSSMLQKRTPPRNSKVIGGIRLLVCNRQQYAPLDLSISRHAFESMQTSFGLGALTLSSFESDIGTYSRFFVYSDKDTSKLERIQTILKAPQKREILNWGLSLSYDINSNTTSGFLYGTGLDRVESGDRHGNHGHTHGTPFNSFLRSIRAAIEAWDHPMLLPCLFLSEHLTCTNVFCTQGTLLMECVQIEHQLGVTKVGQSAFLIKNNKLDTKRKAYAYPLDYKSPPILSRKDTESLTVRINTQSTRVAFTARSPEWNLACAHFILKIMEEIRPSLRKCLAKSDHECKQLLEHNIVLAEAAAHNVAVIKERMALQLNVLYNFVAQLDNQTSAELAASASRDSTSMKILAFISALFLPGSFVSGMFSMGLFDWSGGEDNEILSSRFWIYWAVALPLTAVTVLGWAAWWYFELDRFEKKMESLRGRQDTKNAAPQSP